MSKRPGRKATGRVRSQVLSVRITPELRSKLDESARKHSGGNVSKELERLLDTQFQSERTNPHLKGLTDLLEFMSKVASGADFMDPDIDPDYEEAVSEWYRSPFRYAAFKSAVQVFLEELRPQGKVEPIFDEEAYNVGLEGLEETFGETLLREDTRRLYSDPELFSRYIVITTLRRLHLDRDFQHDIRRKLQKGTESIITARYKMRDVVTALKIETRALGKKMKARRTDDGSDGGKK